MRKYVRWMGEGRKGWSRTHLVVLDGQTVCGKTLEGRYAAVASSEGACDCAGCRRIVGRQVTVQELVQQVAIRLQGVPRA